MKKFIILFAFLSIHVHAQKMYCIEDSVPVYLDHNVESQVVYWLHKSEMVKKARQTKHVEIIDSLILMDYGRPYKKGFFWAEVTTSNHIKGWSNSHLFVFDLYDVPQYKIEIPGLPGGADEVYPVGWSKDGKYYAYMIAGYVDGAVDGLTVRGYIVNTKNNKIETEFTSYTSYDTPIKDAWEKNYSNWQYELMIHSIVQQTKPGQINLLPVKKLNETQLPVRFELTDTATTVWIKYGAEIEMNVFYGYRETIECLGWITCPYNKNVMIVFTSSNVLSSPNYIEAFAIDTRMLKR